MKLRISSVLLLMFFAVQIFAQQANTDSETAIPEFAESEIIKSLIEEVAPVIDFIPANDLYKGRWDNNNIRYSATEFVKSSDTLEINLVGNADTPFFYPVKGKMISKYGPRSGRLHTGTDIKLNSGDTVRCAFDGVVRLAKRFSGYGNMVLVRHNNGLETVYAHLKAIKVKVNEPIKAGDLIGLGGRTGRATTDHLHFETRIFGEHFDSKKYLDFDLQMLTCEKLYYKNKKVYKEIESIKEKPIAPPSDLLAKKDNDISDAAIASLSEHVIRKGDNLWSIAKRYNTSVKNICSLNGITTEHILKIGQKLQVKEEE
ncbi:MAG: peptidoglycan DD-metalloendopeptidase family protein [Prolixibacteraceae bacterium]|nr:peptidoglycan DD-metalloendopeptidase family protein [Prolixibacteraceae bacterium]